MKPKQLIEINNIFKVRSFRNNIIFLLNFAKMTVKPREKPVETEEDPVENMLKKTGCIELHYKVQECIAMTRDWRKCQTEVNEFRDCINKHKQEDTKLKSN